MKPFPSPLNREGLFVFSQYLFNV